MSKILNLTQNVLGVFALVSIVALSTFVTMGLSPIAVDESVIAGGTNSTGGNLAGAATTDKPQFLSNFLPLTISDESEPSPRYTSQLVKLPDGSYDYNVKIAAHDKGEFNRKMIRIVNPNSAPVTVYLRAHLPAEVNGSMHIAVSGKETYRLHDASSSTVRTVAFELDPGEDTLLTLNYDYLQNVLFPVDISYQLFF